MCQNLHNWIWGKYSWNKYLFQNNNIDEYKNLSPSISKLRLPSGLQSHAALPSRTTKLTSSKIYIRYWIRLILILTMNTNTPYPIPFRVQIALWGWEREVIIFSVAFILISQYSFTNSTIFNTVLISYHYILSIQTF